MDKDQQPSNKNSFVENNQEANAKNETVGEAEVEKYDDINRKHQTLEDIDEVQSTEDV